MGTQSTVKFKDNKGKVVLSVYNHYDGYVQGVGVDLARTIKKWYVDGVTETWFNPVLRQDLSRVVHSNGIRDLSLLYVLDNKGGGYNMYVTDEDDSKEFDYVVEESPDGKGLLVSVYEQYYVSEAIGYKAKLQFAGTHEEYFNYVEGIMGNPL